MSPQCPTFFYHSRVPMAASWQVSSTVSVYFYTSGHPADSHATYALQYLATMDYLPVLTTAKDGLFTWKLGNYTNDNFTSETSKSIYTLIFQIHNSLESMLHPCTTKCFPRSSLGIFASFEHSKRWSTLSNWLLLSLP
jgi:hypothetical protein